MKKNYEKEVLEFTEMMELLLESGLSIRDALEALAVMDNSSSAEKLSLGKTLLGYIHKGVSFAQAVAMMEEFPPIYRGMIRVGNFVGSVEKIFPRLGAYLRDRKKIRDKIAGALAYPALLLTVAFLGTMGFLFFVMPRMELVFAGFGADAGNSIRRNVRALELAIGVPAALGALLFTALGILQKNSVIDRLALAVPLAGEFIVSWESFNFVFAMEVLTGGGIPVEDAILEAAALVSNGAYRHSLLQARERVLNGGSLARAFFENPLCPSCMGQWAAIGEGSGKTERVFAQLRSYFQGELERRSAKFILLIEPAMIAIIGMVILALVTGILLPLFSVYGTIL
ncbi:MAG: type II secretion system F family protein [Treponema sp.]|jgi:type II secretory pathway component PulF|nr:type II secretion system F family protein [Treponema sp.]